MTRIAFDSNILVYLAGGERIADDRPKIREVQRLVPRCARVAELVAPVQSMGETLRVLILKFGKTENEIAETLLLWRESFEPVPTSFDILRDAVKLAAVKRLQHWDAVIIAASVAVGCDVLLSEDMQDGFVWRGLTIVNPFADPVHPLLASLLA